MHIVIAKNIIAPYIADGERILWPSWQEEAATEARIREAVFTANKNPCPHLPLIPSLSLSLSKALYKFATANIVEYTAKQMKSDLRFNG